MNSATREVTLRERELLDAARRGDEDAFRDLVEPHGSELHAHCYPMLGSVHDADDALQDTLLRAWRAMPSFEGRGSLRSWLYRIATNTCLSLIERRSKRVLPLDYGPASDPHDDPAEPSVAVAVAVFAAAGSYASAQAFTDGFAPAIGVTAGLALLGALIGLGLPGKVREARVSPPAAVPVLATDGEAPGGSR